MKTEIKYAFWILIIIAISSFTVNFAATAMALSLLLFILTKFFFSDRNTVVFGFILLYQWVQISVKILYADSLGIEADFLSIYNAPIVPVFFQSSVSLFALSLGFMVFRTKADLKSIHIDFNSRKILIIYTLFIFLGPAVLAPLTNSGGLFQIVQKLLEIKWVFFLLLFLQLKKEGMLKLMLPIIIGEIVIGFTGYFSSFKNVIFIAVICYFMTENRIRVSIPRVITSIVTGMMIVCLFALWQYIKPEYRNYLSKGEGQVVNVSKSEALSELWDMASDIGGEELGQGFFMLIDRASYIDFFSVVKKNVPVDISYEGGVLWRDALTSIMMPRFLFPDKRIINDSEKTNYYTGLELAGADQATSISLGYVAETYIDFGPYFMYLILFAWGAVVSFLVFFFLNKSYNEIWGFAYTLPLFFNLYLFEMSLDKMTGAVFYYFVVVIIFDRLFAKKISAWLSR